MLQATSKNNTSKRKQFKHENVKHIMLQAHEQCALLKDNRKRGAANRHSFAQ